MVTAGAAPFSGAADPAAGMAAGVAVTGMAAAGMAAGPAPESVAAAAGPPSAGTGGNSLGGSDSSPPTLALLAGGSAATANGEVEGGGRMWTAKARVSQAAARVLVTCAKAGQAYTSSSHTSSQQPAGPAASEMADACEY